MKSQPLLAIRHLVLAITTLMAVLLYLDRYAISMTAEAMQADLGLNEEQMGLVFSAFFFAYALAQVPSGWLGDRLGRRMVLTGCIFLWSLFTLATGLAFSLSALLGVRLLFGVAQAGAYPNTARIYSHWIPFHRRGYASGMVSLGGRAGAVLAPAVTALLLTAFSEGTTAPDQVAPSGWRIVYLLYGVAGVGLAALFWTTFRDTPAEHPWCSAEERHLIEQGRPTETSSPHGTADALPLEALLRSRSLWLLCLSAFTANIGWTFMVTWFPTYLRSVHEVKLLETGFLASLPAVAGMAGCLVGGIATDWMTARLGLAWGRRMMGVLSKVAAAAALLAAIWVGDATVASLVMALVWFSSDTSLGSSWSFYQDVGGPYVGTVFGWCNMFGNLGGAVSPVLVGWLVKHLGWSEVFLTCAAAYTIAAVCWLGVDARKPIGTSQRRRGAAA